MFKKILSSILALVLVVSMLAGCGGSDTKDTTKASEATTKATEAKTEASKGDNTEATEESKGGYDDLITIEIYDAAANFHGVQTGWFAQVIAEKCGLELNIIAPQVAGDALYQTRTAEGNLGDIVILDKGDFLDCYTAGLIKDISAELKECNYIMDYKVQIDNYNQGLGLADGVYYGIPAQMTDTSPVTISGENVYSSVWLRWDQYKGIGSPAIADLDGLLDVLAQIHEKYPTNDAGDPAYPFTLWADWDGGDNMIGIANIVQINTWYGEKIKESAILKADGKTFTTIYDKDASYYKMAKFLNKAYRMGLVDPDSGTQDWNSVMTKISNGQVNLLWYNWQQGFWNSTDRLADGTAFTVIPVEDQYYYGDADNYYGSTRVWGVGSKVEGDKYDRIMNFLNWYASPEGLQYEHCGIEGFTYTVNADGTFTQINSNALMDNLPVPAEYGGGGYNDGSNQINQWLCEGCCTNPNTGEKYSVSYWKSYKEANMTQMKKEWQEKYGAENAVDWMTKNGKLNASPNVQVALEPYSSELSLIRNQVNQKLCDYSWKLIFVESDAEFDAMWDEMIEMLNGLDYMTLYEFDTKNYQTEIDAKNAAKANMK